MSGPRAGDKRPRKKQPPRTGEPKQAASPARVEKGKHAVARSPQAARRRAQSAAAARTLEDTLQPSVEIQRQMLQIRPVPIAPAVSQAGAILAGRAQPRRDPRDLKPWRDNAEAYLQSGNLQGLAQAMVDGQLATLTCFSSGWTSLIHALWQIPALQRVHLVNVTVSPAAAVEFGRALQAGRTLKKLGLTSCHHQAGAFNAMMMALMSYGGLESLKIAFGEHDSVDPQTMRAAALSLIARNPGLQTLTLAGGWIDEPSFLPDLVAVLSKLPRFRELEIASCPCHLFGSLMTSLLQSRDPWRLPQLTLKRAGGDQNKYSFDAIVNQLVLCPINRLRIKAVTLSNDGMTGLINTMLTQWRCRTQVEFDLVNQLADLESMRGFLKLANESVAKRIGLLSSNQPSQQL